MINVNLSDHLFSSWFTTTDLIVYIYHNILYKWSPLIWVGFPALSHVVQRRFREVETTFSKKTKYIMLLLVST